MLPTNHPSIHSSPNTSSHSQFNPFAHSLTHLSHSFILTIYPSTHLLIHDPPTHLHISSSTHSSVYPSTHPPVHSPIQPFINSFTQPPVYPHVHQSIHLSMHSFTDPLSHLSVHSPTRLSIYVSSHLPIHLPTQSWICSYVCNTTSLVDCPPANMHVKNDCTDFSDSQCLCGESTNDLGNCFSLIIILGSRVLSKTHSCLNTSPLRSFESSGTMIYRKQRYLCCAAWMKVHPCACLATLKVLSKVFANKGLEEQGVPARAPLGLM